MVKPLDSLRMGRASHPKDQVIKWLELLDTPREGEKAG